MPNIKPFRGYYYNEDIAGNLEDVVAPPYDVISLSQREELYAKSPFNIVRVILGKELPRDSNTSNKYSRAYGYLQDWIDKGALKEDERAAFYLLEQEFTYNGVKYSRLGLVALIELVDFSQGQVFPHEETLSAPKVDRLKLLEAVKANFSPIFSFYIDEKDVVGEVFNGLKKYPPFLQTVGSDKVKNNLWRLTDESQISRITAMLKERQVFIADGHHRYETALNYRKSHAGTASDGANFILMYFANIEQEGLLVLPVHRLIKEANVSTWQEFEAKTKVNMQKVTGLKEVLEAIETEGPSHKFGLFFDGSFFVLNLKEEDLGSIDVKKSDAYKDLDITLLHELLIRKISATQGEGNIDFTKDAAEAVGLVKANKYKMAFFVKPTTLAQIKDVALCGERMPKKSTYFYPKLLSGLIINRF